MLDFRNNLIYNSIHSGYTGKDPAHLNYIGNYIKRGPDSQYNQAFQIGGPATQLHAAGNRMAGFDVTFRDDWDMIRGARDCNKRRNPFPAVPVLTEDADSIYDQILTAMATPTSKKF